MKRIKALTFIGMGLVIGLYAGIWTFAGADPITATGYMQRDIYNYLVDVQTLANATKTAHNSTFVSMSTIKANQVDLLTKHNLTFSKLSTLTYRVQHAASFASMTGSAASKIVVAGGRPTTTALVVAGGRITATALDVTSP
jgi:hypothetical protein